MVVGVALCVVGVCGNDIFGNPVAVCTVTHCGRHWLTGSGQWHVSCVVVLVAWWMKGFVLGGLVIFLLTTQAHSSNSSNSASNSSIHSASSPSASSPSALSPSASSPSASSHGVSLPSLPTSTHVNARCAYCSFLGTSNHQSISHGPGIGIATPATPGWERESLSSRGTRRGAPLGRIPWPSSSLPLIRSWWWR